MKSIRNIKVLYNIASPATAVSHVDTVVTGVIAATAFVLTP